MSAVASPIPTGPEPRNRVRPDVDVSGLPPRVVEVARHYAGGFGYKEIAARYDVSIRIISRELECFREKTGAFSRRDIVLTCRRLGLEPI